MRAADLFAAGVLQSEIGREVGVTSDDVELARGLGSGRQGSAAGRGASEGSVIQSGTGGDVRANNAHERTARLMTLVLH